MEEQIKDVKEQLRVLQEEREELQRAIYLCQEGKTAWVCVHSEYKGVCEDVQVPLAELDLHVLVAVRREHEKRIREKLSF